MKSRAGLLMLLASVLAGAPPENSAIVGVWRGTMDGLPVMTLTVTDESGSLSGETRLVFI